MSHSEDPVASKNAIPRTEMAFYDLGGDEEDRTPGLGIANAALSQLSYIPAPKKF